MKCLCSNKKKIVNLSFKQDYCFPSVNTKRFTVRIRFYFHIIFYRIRVISHSYFRRGKTVHIEDMKNKMCVEGVKRPSEQRPKYAWANTSSKLKLDIFCAIIEGGWTLFRIVLYIKIMFDLLACTNSGTLLSSLMNSKTLEYFSIFFLFKHNSKALNLKIHSWKYIAGNIK